MKQYVIALISFLGLDAVWLGVIAKNYYFTNLGQFMSPTPNFAAAALFYILNPIGLLIFVLPRSKTVQQALQYGALFGFFTYATYDLTNLATLKNWPVVMSIIDIGWGMTVSAATAALVTYFTKKK